MQSTEQYARRQRRGWSRTPPWREECQARWYPAGASASSSLVVPSRQETNRSLGSYAPRPRPQRHKDDTRFDSAVRKRKVYCGSCKRAFAFDGFGFDGAYMHKCSEAEAKDLKSEAWLVKRTMYLAGTWDATWWCSECWFTYYHWQSQPVSTLEDVRRRLGVRAAQMKEYHRKRSRTQGSTYKNVRTSMSLK